MGQPRFYRHWAKDGDLVSFSVAVGETDLYLRSRSNLEEETRESIVRHRALLEDYIASHPGFADALEPVSVENNAPAIVRDMARAAELSGVGPMASVAGAIAETVGRDLLAFSAEVIVENGGDIFLVLEKGRTVGIYAGDSPFTGKLALKIGPGETPLGICTSSGTVGHSLSFGRADAVIVLSPSTALADAAATAIGNIVGDSDDIPRAVEFAQGIDGVAGVVVIKGERMGMWGRVRLADVAGVGCEG
jgi:ApbE superfamily uncharacterized protein (UPF0280 family)